MSNSWGNRRAATACAAMLVALTVIASLVAPSVARAKGPGPTAGKLIYVGGERTFEPTLGVDGAGRIFYSTTDLPGVAIGWRPGMAMSEDGGATWRNIAPQVAGRRMPPETNDPYIYVDQSTGRIFNFHMSPILTCSILSFSDNQGANWTTNPLGCGPTAIWDHQTLVAAKPRTVTTSGYPNVLVQCVNAVYAAMCSRSTNGGLTWSPSTPVHINDKIANLCGAQHGHLASAPDGTIYLPSPVCGTNPTVFVSRDDGISWRRSVISDINIPFVDPSVATDEHGNVYAAFIDENGWLHYSVSRDLAQTWSAPVKVAEGVTGQMPVVAVGDPGKVVIAFPGTDDLPQGFATDWYPSDADRTKFVEWGGYLAVAYNGLDSDPTFTTVSVNGSDPLVRGAACGRGTRCNYFVDFIDATVGPDGRPYAAFVDGCTGTCATTPGASNNEGRTGLGVIGTLGSGRKLCKSGCAWKFGGAATERRRWAP